MDTLRTKFSKMMVQADNEDFDEEEFTNTLKDYIQSLSNQNGGKSRKEKIRQKDIIQVITEKTGLSKGTVSKSHSSFNLFEKKMNSEIFGQSEAINKIYDLYLAQK